MVKGSPRRSRGFAEKPLITEPEKSGVEENLIVSAHINGHIV